jgi:hypothetical protein
MNTTSLARVQRIARGQRGLFTLEDAQSTGVHR